MACIVFLIDNHKGHVLSSFGLAHTLTKAGHNIIYINTSENEQLIRQQGFNLFAYYYDREPVLSILDGKLDPLFKQERPDLLIVSSHLILECLILHYKYNVRPVILTNYLKNPDFSVIHSFGQTIMSLSGDILADVLDGMQSLDIKFDSLAELAEPLAGFHELILCPQDLEMDVPSKNGRNHHLGPSIRPDDDVEIPLGLDKIVKEQKVIYASLGSMEYICDESSYRVFCQRLVNVMRHPQLSNMYLIISVRHKFDQNTFGPMPGNVYVSQWIPQIPVIQKASLVINHGGLSTIKECIYFGVPMIVLPLLNIHYRHAMLVDYHRVGISEQMELMSEDNLRHSILYVLGNGTIKGNVDTMKTIFRAKADLEDGTAIIKELVNQSSWKNIEKDLSSG